MTSLARFAILRWKFELLLARTLLHLACVYQLKYLWTKVWSSSVAGGFRFFHLPNVNFQQVERVFRSVAVFLFMFALFRLFINRPWRPDFLRCLFRFFDIRVYLKTIRHISNDRISCYKVIINLLLIRVYVKRNPDFSFPRETKLGSKNQRFREIRGKIRVFTEERKRL